MSSLHINTNELLAGQLEAKKRKCSDFAESMLKQASEAGMTMEETLVSCEGLRNSVLNMASKKKLSEMV